jgi:hypothetical protein
MPLRYSVPSVLHDYRMRSCSSLSSHFVQEDDVLDKFGEYGAVKAGTTAPASPSTPATPHFLVSRMRGLQ